MKYLFLIFIIFFSFCTTKYTLKPCYDVSKKNIYNKVLISREAKVKIKSNQDFNDLYLSSDTKEYVLEKKGNNFYVSNKALDKGVYLLSKDLKNVEKIEYLFDEEYLYNLNSRDKSLKKIKAKTIRNSVSKCLSNTSDWYEIIPRSDCYGSKIYVSLVTKSPSINFEILKNNKSLGLLENNKVYTLFSKDKNIIHIFTDETCINSYLLKIEELCYPRRKVLKVTNKIDMRGLLGLLVEKKKDFGLVKGMKFYYLSENSLNYCFIEDISDKKALCVFSGVKIQKVPKELYFDEYEIGKQK